MWLCVFVFFFFIWSLQWPFTLTPSMYRLPECRSVARSSLSALGLFFFCWSVCVWLHSKKKKLHSNQPTLLQRTTMKNESNVGNNIFSMIWNWYNRFDAFILQTFFSYRHFFFWSGELAKAVMVRKKTRRFLLRIILKHFLFLRKKQTDCNLHRYELYTQFVIFEEEPHFLFGYNMFP